MNKTDSIPFVDAAKSYYLLQFPNLPTKCPIKPGKYYSENVTVFDENKQSFGASNILQKLTIGELPNGVYRHVVKLSTIKDPVGFVLYWHVEIHNAMGANDFK